MSKIVKNKRVKIGEVCVDSGQLLVCDPCYIRSQWDDDDDNPGAPHYETPDGKKWGCSLHKSPTAEYWFDHFEEPLPEYDGKTPNQLRAEGKFTEVAGTPSGKMSYGGCCQATHGDTSAGELKFNCGHSGAGVAFASGYGDGCYPVYATYNKEGRIIKVEIDMS